MIRIIKDDSTRNPISEELRISTYRITNYCKKTIGNLSLMINGCILYDGNKISMQPDNYWTDIAYANNVYLAISSSNSKNSSRIMTSTDGIIWIPRKSYDYGWQSIMYDKHLHIFIIKDSFENIMWIDSISFKTRLFKYKHIIIPITRSTVRRTITKPKIEENIIYIRIPSKI